MKAWLAILFIGIVAAESSASTTSWVQDLEVPFDIIAGIGAGLGPHTGYSSDLCVMSIWGIISRIYDMAQGANVFTDVVTLISDVTNIIADCPLAYQKIYNALLTWSQNFDGKISTILSNLGKNFYGLYQIGQWIVEDIPAGNWFWVGYDVSAIVDQVLNLYSNWKPPTLPSGVSRENEWMWGLLYGLSDGVFKGSVYNCVDDFFNIYAVFKHLADGYDFQTSDLGTIFFNLFKGVGDCKESYYWSLQAVKQVVASVKDPKRFYFNLDWDISICTNLFAQGMANVGQNNFKAWYYFSAVAGKVLVYDKWPHYGSYDSSYF